MNGIKCKILDERKWMHTKTVCYICSHCYQKVILITVPTKMYGACLCLELILSFIYTSSMFNSEDMTLKNPPGVVPELDLKVL